MVLQDVRTANLTKDENAAPSSSTRPKGLVSRIYEDASSRGRTRSSGTSHTSKHRIQEAKRRKAKAKASGRTNVRTAPTEADVEMSNAASSSSGTPQPATVRCGLPPVLRRPYYKEVSLEIIREVEPALEDMDLSFIRTWLAWSSPTLVKALHNIQADPMKDKLPREMTVHAPEMNDFLPTHMLAVFAQTPPNAETGAAPRKVTLYPVHSLVLLAHCATIPKPPPAIPPPVVGETQVVLPVWHICLPDPSVYPQLSTYLYSKQLSHILRAFMPTQPPPDFMTNPVLAQGFAMHLSQTYTVPAIMKCIFNVLGLWKNVCSLGIFDDNLWDAMDVMWRTLLTTLAIATNKPNLLQLLPRPGPSSSQSATSATNQSP